MAEEQGGARSGFFQVITRTEVQYCRKVMMTDAGVLIYGPTIVTMHLIPNKDTRKQDAAWNKDTVVDRFLPWAVVVGVDALDPSSMAKEAKGIYEQLSGIALT